MSEELIKLAADIVSAFVSHNSTRPGDMIDLLKQVYGRLTEVMNGKSEPVEDAIVPAVSIKRSITHDAVFCMVCGAGHKTLKRHLRSFHSLEPAAYREMFGLKPDYSFTAPSYSATRSGLATKLGLGRKAKVAEPEPIAVPIKPAKAKKEKPEAAKLCFGLGRKAKVAEPEPIAVPISPPRRRRRSRRRPSCVSTCKSDPLIGVIGVQNWV